MPGTDVSNESIAEPLDRKETVNVARLPSKDEEGGIGRKWTSKGPVVKLPCYAPGETWWYRGSMQNSTQIGTVPTCTYSRPCVTG